VEGLNHQSRESQYDFIRLDKKHKYRKSWLAGGEGKIKMIELQYPLAA